MSYAQIRYNDIQGINGKYRISEIGCLITSFCNLSERFGKHIDPPSINRELINRGLYVDVDDGIRDDVGWATISAVYSDILVSGTGNGGWPPHNNAIVKFVYKSPKTGRMMTHFALVADHNAGTIVDPWDGVVRSPGYYGQPVAWATYGQRVAVQPVTPAAPAPPAAPLPIPTSTDKYSVVKILSGYNTATEAHNNINQKILVNPGAYFVFNRAKGMVNVTRTPGKPGAWINPADNVEPPPPPPPQTTPAVVEPPHVDIPVQVVPKVEEIDWRTTYSANRDWNGGEILIEYNAENLPDSFIDDQGITRHCLYVRDIAGKRPDKRLIENQQVKGKGYFYKDDIKYVRPAFAVMNGDWYGIPEKYLRPEEVLMNTDTKNPEYIAARKAYNNIKPADIPYITYHKTAALWTKFFDVIKTPKKTKTTKTK